VQEDLAKFGHKPGMKIEKFKNPLYFDYLLEPIVEIWQFNLFKIWRI